MGDTAADRAPNIRRQRGCARAMNMNRFSKSGVLLNLPSFAFRTESRFGDGPD
jgi:hypothetical protein